MTAGDKDTLVISIHALLAESDGTAVYQQRYTTFISIHALLAESDTMTDNQRIRKCISIHALLAESDQAPGTT